eukprot:gene13000-biopygen13393
MLTATMPVSMAADNHGSIHLASDHVDNNRSKHIEPDGWGGLSLMLGQRLASWAHKWRRVAKTFKAARGLFPHLGSPASGGHRLVLVAGFDAAMEEVLAMRARFLMAIGVVVVKAVVDLVHVSDIDVTESRHIVSTSMAPM